METEKDKGVKSTQGQALGEALCPNTQTYLPLIHLWKKEGK
jgi:hypothetical protein